jgi:hypothetical protein
MLRMNVGFTKKVGEANFGSRGASIHLELELDSGLVGDPERLKERIRQLFALVKASVDEELAAQAPPSSQTNGDRRDGTRRATASQIRALVAIAERRQLDLEGLLAERFHTREAAELSIVEASQLIDELKGSANNGNGGRR